MQVFPRIEARNGPLAPSFAALLLAIAVLTLGGPRAAAQAPQVILHLDGEHSKVYWSVEDTTHTVRGTFQLKGGLVTYNPDTGVADGELLVDVTSAQSGNKTRDTKLKTQILEAQKFPQAFFHPTLVKGTLKDQTTQKLTVSGTFNIHGADHPLTLTLDVKVEGTAVSATTTFNVPYVAWGMTDPSVFLFRVAKQVKVDVQAQGRIEGVR